MRGRKKKLVCKHQAFAEAAEKKKRNRASECIEFKQRENQEEQRERGARSLERVMEFGRGEENLEGTVT